MLLVLRSREVQRARRRSPPCVSREERRASPVQRALRFRDGLLTSLHFVRRGSRFLLRFPGPSLCLPLLLLEYLGTGVGLRPRCFRALHLSPGRGQRLLGRLDRLFGLRPRLGLFCLGLLFLGLTPELENLRGL